MAAPRKKLITWLDPAETVRDIAAMSGLEHLQAIKDGRLPPPPVANLLGYRIAEIQHGEAVFELKPEECLYNPFSTIHGGILSTLLDTTMTSAVMSILPVGQGCMTVDMTIKYFLPATINSGTLRCTAGIVHSGRRMATADGKIHDAKNSLIAHGISTCSILFPRSEKK